MAKQPKRRPGPPIPPGGDIKGPAPKRWQTMSGAKSRSGRLVSKFGATAAKKAAATKKRAMGGARYGAGGVSKLGVSKIGAKKRRRVSLTGGGSPSPAKKAAPKVTGPKPVSRRQRRFGRGG